LFQLQTEPIGVRSTTFLYPSEETVPGGESSPAAQGREDESDWPLGAAFGAGGFAAAVSVSAGGGATL